MATTAPEEARSTGKEAALGLLETHGGVPIYLLSYPAPVALDRAAHEEEMEMLLRLPEPRFALIIDYQNISHALDYQVSEEVEVHQTSLGRQLRPRLAAVARIRPASLSALVRTMVVHIYARQGGSSGFAPDLEAALRVVRRAIDR